MAMAPVSDGENLVPLAVNPPNIAHSGLPRSSRLDAQAVITLTVFDCLDWLGGQTELIARHHILLYTAY